MKKNGFIATSLIYSFFLIFITLFLTIIAEGLQQKLWLNEIEKGIKDEINSSMGIKDFEVGDMINVSKEGETDVYSIWIIANVDYTRKELILYSFDFEGKFPSCPSSTTTSLLTYEHIKNDINSGYMNQSYFNKIIYTFNEELGTNYMLSDDDDTNFNDNKFVETDAKNIKQKGYLECTKNVEESCTSGEEGCICDGDENCIKTTKEICDTSNIAECNSCNLKDGSSIIQDNLPYENNNNFIVTNSDLEYSHLNIRRRVVVSLGDSKFNKKVIGGDGIIMLSC